MCLFALLPASSIVSPSWINSLFFPQRGCYALAAASEQTPVKQRLFQSRRGAKNSPAAGTAPSRQRQRLGSALAGGGCSKPLHLLLQRRWGAAPGWQCLLLEQRQTSSQSWEGCNWGITGVSMVLLILPDQSSTPEMTAGFLLCCRSPRTCYCCETHGYGRGSAALPWVAEELLYFQGQCNPCVRVALQHYIT